MTSQDLFMQHLISFLNVPYKWGGSNPLAGLDCSGLVQLGLGFLGLDPPGDQTADALWKRYKSSPAQVPFLGCLAFYGRDDEATHVGIMMGPVHMIEAGGGGRSVKEREDAARAGAYVKLSRFNRRSDLLGFCNPGLPWGP